MLIFVRSSGYILIYKFYISFILRNRYNHHSLRNLDCDLDYDLDYDLDCDLYYSMDNCTDRPPL